MAQKNSVVLRNGGLIHHRKMASYAIESWDPHGDLNSKECIERATNEEIHRHKLMSNSEA